MTYPEAIGLLACAVLSLELWHAPHRVERRARRRMRADLRRLWRTK